jgi:hypothetical protein
MSTPVAINSIGELRRRVIAGHHDFAILLAGRMMRSSKFISLNPCDVHADPDVAGFPCTEGSACLWDVINEIDGSVQEDMTDIEFWTQSNIGEALDKNALIDDDGDEGGNPPSGGTVSDPPPALLMEGPMGIEEAFDAFEVHDVAESPDPSGGTYMEPRWHTGRLGGRGHRSRHHPVRTPGGVHDRGRRSGRRLRRSGAG